MLAWAPFSVLSTPTVFPEGHCPAFNTQASAHSNVAQYLLAKADQTKVDHQPMGTHPQTRQQTVAKRMGHLVGTETQILYDQMGEVTMDHFKLIRQQDP